MTTLLFAVAFIMGFAADSLWTLYVRCIAEKRALPAATVSAAIAGLGLVAVLIIVWNPWTIVADVVGGFLGTYVAVRRSI